VVKGSLEQTRAYKRVRHKAGGNKNSQTPEARGVQLQNSLKSANTHEKPRAEKGNEIVGTIVEGSGWSPTECCEILAFHFRAELRRIQQYEFRTKKGGELLRRSRKQEGESRERAGKGRTIGPR